MNPLPKVMNQVVCCNLTCDGGSLELARLGLRRRLVRGRGGRAGGGRVHADHARRARAAPRLLAGRAGRGLAALVLAQVLVTSTRIYLVTARATRTDDD